jgi:hypothetical protein
MISGLPTTSLKLLGASGPRSLRTTSPRSKRVKDVRLVLKTKDDVLISMTYQGVRHGPPDVVERIEKGEVVDPTSYYFRINPLFDTAAAKVRLDQSRCWGRHRPSPSRWVDL